MTNLIEDMLWQSQGLLGGPPQQRGIGAPGLFAEQPPQQPAQPQAGAFDGGFMSPGTQGLLGAAAALLQAGGPSTRRVGLGQALGAGLQGAAQGIQQGQQFRDQGEMRDQRRQALARQASQDAARLRQDATLQAEIAKLPEDQRAVAIMNPEAWAKARVEAQYAAPKAPTIQTFYEGMQRVDKQWNPATNQWDEVGRGTPSSPSVNVRLPPQFSPPSPGYQYTTDPRTGMPVSQSYIPGGPADPERQTTANVGKIQENLTQIGERAARIDGIAASWKPEFNTLLNKVGNWYVAGKESLGLPTSDAERAGLAEATTARTKIITNLNSTITEITGAAMGIQEAGRIGQQVPTLDDSPTQFETKLKDTTKALKLAYARQYYLLRNNIPHDLAKGQAGGITLDSMASVIDKRGEQLAQELGAKPGDPRVLQALKAEFGL